MESQVKVKKSELNEQFNSAYYSLPVKLYLTVRTEICEALDWKTSTFYNRLRSDRPIKKIEKPLIEEVFNKYGFKVFNS